ncbi:hypothetical protein EVAR_91928_1 [Eumeta japonica]|uniref:Uncharacterized protein n=1 Tax=Eumeta variegata TaxID=151549 RepID=A0A4C1SWT5_EUMVA|nr:hypothetical protein EVAR_91928_1 [Eumeta japonica]
MHHHLERRSSPFRCFYRDYIGVFFLASLDVCDASSMELPNRSRLYVEDSLDEHIGVPAPAPHIRFFPGRRGFHKDSYSLPLEDVRTSLYLGSACGTLWFWSQSNH